MPRLPLIYRLLPAFNHNWVGVSLSLLRSLPLEHLLVGLMDWSVVVHDDKMSRTSRFDEDMDVKSWLIYWLIDWLIEWLLMTYMLNPQAYYGFRFASQFSEPSVHHPFFIYCFFDGLIYCHWFSFSKNANSSMSSYLL